MRKLILGVDNWNPGPPFSVYMSAHAWSPNHVPYSTIIASDADGSAAGGGAGIGFSGGLCYSCTYTCMVWDLRSFSNLNIVSVGLKFRHRGHGSYPFNQFPSDAAGGYALVPLDENYASIDFLGTGGQQGLEQNYNAVYRGALTGVEFMDRVPHSAIPDDHDYHDFSYVLNSAGINYLNSVESKPNFPGYAFFGIITGGIVDGVSPSPTANSPHNSMSSMWNATLLIDFDETLIENAVEEQITLDHPYFLDGHTSDPTRFIPDGEPYVTMFDGDGTTGQAGTKSVRLEPHLDLANPGLWDRNTWIDLIIDLRPFKNVIFTHPCSITLVDISHSNKNFFGSDTKDGIALIKQYEYGVDPAQGLHKYHAIRNACVQNQYWEMANRITRTELIAANSSDGNVTFTLNENGLYYLNNIFNRAEGYEQVIGFASFAIVWGGQADASTGGGNPTFLHNTSQVVSYNDMNMDLTYIVTSGNRLNVGDGWKYVTGGMINVGDSWKQADEIELNVDDNWKKSSKIP